MKFFQEVCQIELLFLGILLGCTLGLILRKTNRISDFAVKWFIYQTHLWVFFLKNQSHLTYQIIDTDALFYIIY